jgi:hypothetical protein
MEVTQMSEKQPSIRDFIFQDMWGHILMSGPDITGYLSGEKYPTAAEQESYCQGIFTMFPHMLLSGFTRWLWTQPPKDYSAFMEPSVQALQAKVFPVLAECFQGGLSQSQRGEKLIPLLTEVIPKHVLTGFYDYMFAGQPDYKDICDFWPQVQPILDLTARGLRAAYDTPMPLGEKQELFLFVGTRMPYLLLKRWYDWQFGPEKLEMPPPPPET